MNLPTRFRLTMPEAVALTAVLFTGAGTITVLAGVGARDVPVAVISAGIAAVGLGVLLVGGWVEGAALLLLSLPLPAAGGSGDFRITAAALLTLMVVVAWLLRWGALGYRLRVDAVPVRSAAAVLLAFGVSTLFAEARGLAVRETFNFALLVALLVAMVDMLAARPAARRHLALLMAGVAGVTGAAAALESAGVLPGAFPLWGTGANRAALGLGQPNALGLFLAILLPFSVYAVGRSKSMATRLLAVTCLVLTMIGLFGTFSRGSWLAVLTGSLPLLLTAERRFVGRIWIWALLGAVALDVASGGLVRDSIARILTDWSVEQRAALMLAGWLIFLANPIVGVGPGGFADQVERFSGLVPQLWDIKPTPHNAYVQMAAEVGVVGLVTFVVFMLVVLWAILRVARTGDRETVDIHLARAAAWSFGTVCAAGFVGWPFAHGVGQLGMMVAAIGLTLPVGRAEA